MPGAFPPIIMLSSSHGSACCGERDAARTSLWCKKHTGHVTSTGCSNMHSGVLVMLARSKFQHAVIRKEAPMPGRVLEMRVQQGGMVVHLINVYQKVWNGPQEARTQRAQVLDAIQKQVHAVLARYPLVLAGDFNAALRHQPPCTGSAVMRSGNATDAPDVQQLQGILRQFDLRALNTYHPYPVKHTFTFHNGETSQIDYTIVRARSAAQVCQAASTRLDTLSSSGLWLHQGSHASTPPEASIDAVHIGKPGSLCLPPCLTAWLLLSWPVCLEVQ